VKSIAKGVLPSRLLLPRSVIKPDVKDLSTYVKLTDTDIFGGKEDNWYTFHIFIIHTLFVLGKVNARIRA
jgi:hypothetical protein